MKIQPKQSKTFPKNFTVSAFDLNDQIERKKSSIINADFDQPDIFEKYFAEVKKLISISRPEISIQDGHIKIDEIDELTESLAKRYPKNENTISDEHYRALMFTTLESLAKAVVAFEKNESDEAWYFLTQVEYSHARANQHWNRLNAQEKRIIKAALGGHRKEILRKADIRTSCIDYLKNNRPVKGWKTARSVANDTHQQIGKKIEHIHPDVDIYAMLITWLSGDKEMQHICGLPPCP